MRVPKREKNVKGIVGVFVFFLSGKKMLEFFDPGASLGRVNLLIFIGFPPMAYLWTHLQTDPFQNLLNQGV
jgi:hypothetical protein